MPPRSYRVSFIRLHDFPHPYPHRTAYKQQGPDMSFDWTCQVWSNRPAMLKACQMSDTGELGNKPWRPLVKP